MKLRCYLFGHDDSVQFTLGSYAFWACRHCRSRPGRWAGTPRYGEIFASLEPYPSGIREFTAKVLESPE